MCNKIQSLQELYALINTLNKEHSKEIVLFRGQDKNYEPVPSAIRDYINTNKKFCKDEFDKLVSEFTKINTMINHSKVARTFIDIFVSLYPQYYSILNDINCTGHDYAQFLTQCIRQQYSRSAMFLDVTTDLSVALKMGKTRFYKENYSLDGRFIIRGEQRGDDEFTYLSVFFVPKDNVITFNESVDTFTRNVSDVLKNINSKIKSGVHIAFNCSNIKKCQRLINQSAWFLSFIPADEEDFSLDNYNFDKVFNRLVYKIPNYLIDEYFDSLIDKGAKTVDLFPQDDFVLQWVNNRKNERRFSVNNSILGESDLGISVYNYFSDIDRLFCPSNVTMPRAT